jgi:subtilase family serine protease
MKNGFFHRKTSFIVVIAVLLLSLAAALIFQLKVSQAHPTTSSVSLHAVQTNSTGATFLIPGSKPPTDAECRTGQSGSGVNWPCLSPQEMRNAYNVTPLLNAGFTGKGQTIVIFDAIGSPTIANDLKVFDAGYGLADPPSFKVIAPLGTIAFDPNNLDHQAWAFETTLDVDWAHVIAPDANIVLVTSPVDETQGVQGMPELLQVEEYALDHHLGNIFSQSWGTTENTLSSTDAGKKVLSDYEAFYARAAAEHISVLASAGDDGTGNPDVNGNIYPYPTVVFPASSPLVTAVGGTSLVTDTSGNYQSESVWNNSALGGYVTGGGISQYFKEPLYQRALLPSAVQKQLNGYRGLPDISYNANARTSSVLAYGSFLPGQAGYYLYGGTSAGVPQWSGIIAITNQYLHHPIGYLNPILYLLGKFKNNVYHDITVGNNSGFAGIPGYDATPGWDLATGWGTPNADAFVHALGSVSPLNCAGQVQDTCSATLAP